MPVQFNTGEWFTLSQGSTFRKLDLPCQFPPEINFGEMLVCPAQYGGPVALVRFIASSLKPEIAIFTATGSPISRFEWNSGKLIKMGWSEAEYLICVQEDGIVLIYNLFGEYQHRFSMGPEVKDTKVIDARIFASSSGTGVAVMTTKFRIHLVNSVVEPKNRTVPEMPKSSNDPTCWEIVTEERHTFAIVARGREIYKLAQGDAVCMPQAISMVADDYQSIINIAVSLNQNHVALYTNNGHIWMGSADLKEKYREFSTGQPKRPSQVCWCLEGNAASALVISYPSQLLIIGIEGGSTQYPFDPVIVLIPEMDCVRVLTNTCHELIQKVPKCVNNIFAINSQEPASFLFEAHKKFEERSCQSDEYLCLIRNQLDVAVSECIEAAVFEFDPVTQKSLIQAAYFGKSFIPGHNPDTYITMCRILRVLNAIRHLGLPLTFHQFIYLSPNVVLDRLVFRKHYGLAIQIAKHMKLTESRILEHWAMHQVKHGIDDEKVARKIADKFKTTQLSNISFCNIAKKAQKRGRPQLAIILLDHESRARHKVPLLMKMGEYEKALQSATMSGDTDLVYIVLLQLKEASDLPDLASCLAKIRSFPMAHRLYKKYCLQCSMPTLRDILNEEDDWLAQAELAMREGFEEPLNFVIKLSTAADAYKKAARNPNQNPQYLVNSELCEEARRLVMNQRSYTEKYGTSFANLSLAQTITKLMRLGDLRVAEKLKCDFKVTDRKYWWLQIQALAAQSRWDDMDRLSRVKKSPIGYEPFVEVCLHHNKPDEAEKYLPRCRDDVKLRWYTKAGMYAEAARFAFETKNPDGLWTIHERVIKKGDLALASTIENYIQQLSSKK